MTLKPFKVLGKPFTFLAGKAAGSIKQKLIMSLVRHVATTTGGALVAHGYLAQSNEELFVGGLASLIGMLSGAKQKQDE